MRRRFIVQLLALVVMMAAQASPVGRQQARQTAERFLQKSGRQLETLSDAAQGRGKTSTVEPFYIFNTVDRQGFVVISGDDRTDPVLGYTEEGSYDETDMPDGLREWLRQMRAEIEALEKLPEAETAAARTRAVDIHQAVSPLTATKWSQGSGKNARGYLYNTLCPLSSDGLRCITGCVATVGAQLMYYYHYPIDETAVVPGYTKDEPRAGADTSADLPPVRFNWDAMKLSYTAADTLTEAERAVSELMLYCGYAAQMNYGPTASAANVSNLANGMAEYFGYDPYTWRYVARDQYTIREWDELVYSEVAAKRPVIFSGKKIDGTGHAFICDGYEDGMFHYNWGWGGSYNGYFRLSALCPYGIKKIENAGYLFNQYIVYGIQPNTGKDPEPEKYPLMTVNNISVDGSTLTISWWNKNNETYGYGIGIGEITANDKIKVVDNKYEYYEDTDLTYNRGYKNRSFDLSTYKLSKGTHKIVPICKLRGETEWKQCKPKSLWFEVTSDGSSSVTIVQHPIDDLKATHFEIIGNKAVDNIQQVDVTVENRQDERITPLYFFASHNYTKGDCVYAAGAAIETGGSEVLTFYFKPDQSGVWNLWVTTDEEGKKVIGQSEVVIQSTPPSGIETVKQTTVTKSLFYDLNGHRINARPSRSGIYIERRQDGTTRKLVVK